MNEWNIQSALFGTVEWTTPSRLPPKWFELNCDFLLKLLLQLSTGRFFAMIEHLRRTWLEIIFHRQHSEEEEEEGCWTKVIYDSLFVQRASFFDSKTTLPVNCVLGYPDSCCWPHSCPVLYSSCCSSLYRVFDFMPLNFVYISWPWTGNGPNDNQIYDPSRCPPYFVERGLEEEVESCFGDTLREEFIYNSLIRVASMCDRSTMRGESSTKS